MMYLALVAFYAICYVVWSRRKLYLLSWKLSGPVALPLLGNGALFFCDNKDIFNKIVDIMSKYKTPLRLWFGPKIKILFSDLESVEKILTSAKCADKDDLYDFMHKPTKGLVSMSGPIYRRDKKILAPLFLRKEIEPYFSEMQGHVKRLVDILDTMVGKPTFDVRIYMQRCISDVVGETIMGKSKPEAQSGKMDYFIETVNGIYRALHERMLKFWLHYEIIFRWTNCCKMIDAGTEELHGYMKKAISAGKENRSKKMVPSILDKMLHIREQNSFWGNDEMVHHLATFYTASEDTTMTVLSIVLVVLGMYPEHQKKIVDELDDVVGNRELDLNDVDKLQYLEMCIKETLRLFPLGPYIPRKTSDEIEIGGLTIPRGCALIIAAYNIHRDPQHWERPEEFYPDHFLPEAVQKRSPFAFLAFSYGVRGCLGRIYAYLLMKIVLANILRRFFIEADGKLQDIKLQTDISIRFWNDRYPIRVKRRL